MTDKKLIYHYTSFEKLQYILKNGTLRFKESTSSNDALDTLGFVNILKSMPQFSASIDMTELLNFILGYYQRDGYTPSTVALVACFSEIPDSRLLWDAYTMHRPGNHKCPYGDDRYCYETPAKYDGVCIAFRQDKLEEILMRAKGVSCDNAHMQAIDYGDSRIRVHINNWLKEAAHSSFQLSKDPDQSQSIIPPIPITRNKVAMVKKSLVIPTLDFLQKVEAYSPFFKHEFWHEEVEVRAALLVTNRNLSKYNISKYDDGIRYFDLEITPDCIDHVITGPEFDDQSLLEINQHTEYKLRFADFEIRESLGTGVIRNQ